jgi:hypothetical protein
VKTSPVEHGDHGQATENGTYRTPAAAHATGGHQPGVEAAKAVQRAGSAGQDTGQAAAGKECMLTSISACFQVE